MTVPIIAQALVDAPVEPAEVAIVGGGAAGIATAIFTARLMRQTVSRKDSRVRILLLDGAKTLGAKILISGGSRCNVTNTSVESADFWRSGSSFVKQILRAFTVPETIGFFREIGVPLKKEEPLGKLFPESNKARTILEALLAEARRLDVEIKTSCRVTGLQRQESGWIVETTAGPVVTKRVVLATGGLSLPKTGSDGFGYVLAGAHGHTIVPPVPALEPLILEGDFHAPLSGIAHEAALKFVRRGEKTVVIEGSLLWTHFGISGPLALNASRFMRRARADGSPFEMTVSFVPDFSSDEVERRLVVASRERPGHKLSTEVGRSFDLPQAVALRIVVSATGDDEALSRLTKPKRRVLVDALTAFPLAVIDGRGYNFAEVTSGGVAIDEINPKTMESRVAAGLYFAGEILDVDGRIGGFNFQWAWSTAMAAARAIARKP